MQSYEKSFDVFISHSAKDAQAAGTIKRHLVCAGLICWKAPDDIMPGESWPQAIMRALGDSRVMLLVWSSFSKASDEVSKELTLAMRNRMTVVPFKIEDVEPSVEWQYHLANTHWMDAFTGPLEEHLEGLSRYLLRIVPPKAGPPSGPGILIRDGGSAGFADCEFLTPQPQTRSSYGRPPNAESPFRPTIPSPHIGENELNFLIEEKLRGRRKLLLLLDQRRARLNAQAEATSKIRQAVLKCQEAFQNKGGGFVPFCVYACLFAIAPRAALPSLVGFLAGVCFLIHARVHAGGFFKAFSGKEQIGEEDCSKIAAKIGDIHGSGGAIFLVIAVLQMAAGVVWIFFAGSDTDGRARWFFPTGWWDMGAFAVIAITVLYFFARLSERASYSALRANLGSGVSFGTTER